MTQLEFTSSKGNEIAPVQSDNLSTIRKMVQMMISNWYYLILSFIITGSAAYFYIINTIPTYRVSTSVLIKDDESSRLPGVDNNILDGINIRPGGGNLDNQIHILTSYTLINKALQELPFKVNCYRKGIFNSVSYYPLDPIRIQPGPDGLPSNSQYIFQYQGNSTFRLFTPSGSPFDLDTILVFGQVIQLHNGSLSIYPQSELENIYMSENKIYIRFADLDALTEAYRSRLSVQNVSRDATIVTLSLEGTNKVKDVVFLDKLTEVFITDNLDKKNQEAMRIIDFIDAQLVNVSDSLITTENQLQEFRSRNRIMDVSAQGQQIIDQAVMLENERAELTLKRNYYHYLEDYLSEENNEEIPISPGTMGIDDPLLASLMQELSSLQAEYFTSGVGERNPLQNQLELRIQNTKQSLRETLNTIKRANQMALDENQEQIDRMNDQASRLPAKERQLLGIERRFNLNNVLYTFLLQRRAEAQIQRASNMPDNELIDPARANIEPVAPNTKMVFIIAVMFGLGIPVLIFMGGDLLRNKVTSEDDLKLLTQLPIIGHIPHSRLSYNTVVLTEPHSRISEAFRSLRTRMEFFTQEAKNPVILVSSSIPGEGKTFTAINLASAYSLAGKKTLLIGFDLRRPTLSKSFELNEKVGLSTYLIGKSKLEDVIFETSFPGLHVIPSGPVPPNPGELTSTAKAKEMFTDLKKKYDFIIVDTAPIGTVADNYAVASIADSTLITVRHGHTNKHFLKTTLHDIQASGINHLGLLVNGVRAKGGSYRYSYNYKYEYKKQSDKAK
jgi:capsular exopolysaccharide synthesis family protein